MADTTRGLATQPLSLPEELILMLLNEETGYFHQVHGWELNCALVGAVLAELSLLSRIDTDMESLHLVDPTEPAIPRWIPSWSKSQGNRFNATPNTGLNGSLSTLSQSLI